MKAGLLSFSYIGFLLLALISPLGCMRSPVVRRRACRSPAEMDGDREVEDGAEIVRIFRVHRATISRIAAEARTVSLNAATEVTAQLLVSI